MHYPEGKSFHCKVTMHGVALLMLTKVTECSLLDCGMYVRLQVLRLQSLDRIISCTCVAFAKTADSDQSILILKSYSLRPPHKSYIKLYYFSLERRSTDIKISLAPRMHLELSRHLSNLINLTANRSTVTNFFGV